MMTNELVAQAAPTELQVVAVVIACWMAATDPRMQTAAYITDGIDLYELSGMQRGPG